MKPITPFAPYYDAIIVGARCAGAATAMLLARKGARVLVVDRSAYGSDILSTHALMRGAVMQLNKWNVLDNIIAAGTPAIRTTTFQYGETIIPLQLKPSFGTDALYAPRRTVLDRALADAARDAGAEFRYGISFKDVLRDRQGRVTGALLSSPHLGNQEVSAGIVIGADGRRSTVARRVDAQVERLAKNSVSCVYAYYDGIEDSGSHWLYTPGFGGGKIPTNAGQHCVFAALPDSRFRRDVRQNQSDDPIKDIFAREHPWFKPLMAGAKRCSGHRLFAGQKGHMKQSYGPGWALVGDAGYFKDPLTAHGITDALRDAEILSEVALDTTPDALMRYQVLRDAMSRELFEISDEIAGFSWNLPELQTLHKRLNNVMKDEQQLMAGGPGDGAVAA